MSTSAYQALRELARQRVPREALVVEVLLQTGLRVSELCALRVGDIQCGEKGQTGLPSATSICCARPCVRSWRRTPLSQRSNQRRGGVGLGYLRFSLSLPVWPRSSSQAATSTRGFTNRDRGGATFSTRT